METVYWSAAYMAHAALRHWLQLSPQSASKSKTDEPQQQQQQQQQSRQSEPPARHIIFTSSVLAFFPVAGYAPYTPAKTAMKALSDTLVQEIAMHNAQNQQAGSWKHDAKRKDEQQQQQQPSPPIKIHSLFPMGILTPGYSYENTLKPSLTLQLEKDDRPQPPDEVARIAIARLEKGGRGGGGDVYLITTSWIGDLLRGIGMAGSVRNGFGIVDSLLAVVGAVVGSFLVRDFMGKCRKWGGGGERMNK